MPIYPAASSFQGDGTTLTTNSSGITSVNPAAIVDGTSITTNPSNLITYGQYQYPSYTFSSNTSLTSDLYATNVTVSGGAVLTTNGFNIYCSGTLDSSGGTITTGTISGSGGNVNGNGNTGGNGSYGIYVQANKIIAGTINAKGQNGVAGNGGVTNAGSGGGGGGVILLSYGTGGYTAGTYSVVGGTGGAAGGSAGANQSGAGGSTLATGGAKQTSSGTGGNGSTPTAPTVTNANIQNWFEGGFLNILSGGGGGQGAAATGGNGSDGTSYTSSYGGSGGGGGANTGAGGNGGAGQVVTFNYGTSVPIPLSTNGVYLSNTTPQTTSTNSFANITPQMSIVPTTTGNILITAYIRANSSTTAGAVRIVDANSNVLDTFTDGVITGISGTTYTAFTLTALSKGNALNTAAVFNLQSQSGSGGTTNVVVAGFNAVEVT